MQENKNPISQSRHCLTFHQPLLKITKDLLLLWFDHASLWKLCVVHYLFRKTFSFHIYHKHSVHETLVSQTSHCGWQSKMHTEVRRPSEQESLKKATFNKCTINISSVHSSRVFSHCCMSVPILKTGHGCLEKSHSPLISIHLGIATFCKLAHMKMH